MSYSFQRPTPETHGATLYPGTDSAMYMQVGWSTDRRILRIPFGSSEGVIQGYESPLDNEWGQSQCFLGNDLAIGASATEGNVTLVYNIRTGAVLGTFGTADVTDKWDATGFGFSRAYFATPMGDGWHVMVAAARGSTYNLGVLAVASTGAITYLDSTTGITSGRTNSFVLADSLSIKGCPYPSEPSKSVWAICTTKPQADSLSYIHVDGAICGPDGFDNLGMGTVVGPLLPPVNHSLWVAEDGVGVAGTSFRDVPRLMHFEFTPDGLIRIIISMQPQGVGITEHYSLYYVTLDNDTYSWDVHKHRPPGRSGTWLDPVGVPFAIGIAPDMQLSVGNLTFALGCSAGVGPDDYRALFKYTLGATGELLAFHEYPYPLDIGSGHIRSGGLFLSGQEWFAFIVPYLATGLPVVWVSGGGPEPIGPDLNNITLPSMDFAPPAFANPLRAGPSVRVVNENFSRIQVALAQLADNTPSVVPWQRNVIDLNGHKLLNLRPDEIDVDLKVKQ